MPAWSLLSGGINATEWFARRFARANALMPAANFDTIIGEDFQNTITTELVDVTGAADANAVSFYNGGVVEVSVGDNVETSSHARLQETQPPSHVGVLAGKYWYAASLVRMIRPSDGEMADTASDAIGLWGDDDNRVGLGLFGNGSGGSQTNWVGYVDSDGSILAKFGPLLDDEESPVWHLFEVWFDLANVHFAIDGVEFVDVIPVENVPNVPATMSMISQRDDVGNPVAPQYDKACVIVASPQVGEAS